MWRKKVKTGIIAAHLLLKRKLYQSKKQDRLERNGQTIKCPGVKARPLVLVKEEGIKVGAKAQIWK
jgi:hypothetical protein